MEFFKNVSNYVKRYNKPNEKRSNHRSNEEKKGKLKTQSTKNVLKVLFHKGQMRNKMAVR